MKPVADPCEDGLKDMHENDPLHANMVCTGVNVIHPSHAY